MQDTAIFLEDESGEAFETKYLVEKVGLSAGWRGFSISHKLMGGDIVVFHLVKPSKFKVVIWTFLLQLIHYLTNAKVITNFNTRGLQTDLPTLPSTQCSLSTWLECLYSMLSLYSDLVWLKIIYICVCGQFWEKIVIKKV